MRNGRLFLRRFPLDPPTRLLTKPWANLGLRTGVLGRGGSAPCPLVLAHWSCTEPNPILCISCVRAMSDMQRAGRTGMVPVEHRPSA